MGTACSMEEKIADKSLSQTHKIAVLIVAGGKGERASPVGKAQIAKQYQPVFGKPVLAWSIGAFLTHPKVDCVLPVIGASDPDIYANLNLSDEAKLLPPVIGGGTRQQSVLAGLEALVGRGVSHVLIHDGARPLVTASVINGVIEALESADGALPVLPVVETLKRSADGKYVDGTQDRSQLYAAQTPQGFAFESILAAHRDALQTSDGFTDDASIAEWAGIKVVLTLGDGENIKITVPEDFERASHILKRRSNMSSNNFETRVGSGFDVHPFVPGDGVTLGGVAIPHTAKLKGHSDADAGLHVLTDAILGALAEGDIGTHFPPSDMKWKGEPSSTFLSFAANRVAVRGGRIVNLDLTIVCEYPKIGPHVAAMRDSIAKICSIDASRVSVKATTSEKMGFIGREEGLATIGTASIEVPRA